MTQMRIRWQKLGGHYHCRVFTARESGTTYANCGSLVFDEREWPDVIILLRGAELIEDEPRP